jgi:uncharacterized protein with HEPN domain
LRSKEPRLRFRDILEALKLIEQFTGGFDLQTFSEDLQTIAAVERKLQQISEAAVRFGDDAEILCPGPPWRNIRGIGNWLRHEYDKVDVETIWNTVQSDLPPLKRAVILALKSIEP